MKAKKKYEIDFYWPCFPSSSCLITDCFLCASPLNIWTAKLPPGRSLENQTEVQVRDLHNSAIPVSQKYEFRCRHVFPFCSQNCFCGCNVVEINWTRRSHKYRIFIPPLSLLSLSQSGKLRGHTQTSSFWPFFASVLEYYGTHSAVKKYVMRGKPLFLG